MKQTLLVFIGLLYCSLNTFAQRVVIQFNAPLSTTPSVSKALLRYDKDFAYSFTLDDGGDDGFTCAYPALKGGKVAENGVTYSGLFFTDGCGNSIPFKAGIAWNSANIYGQDVHDGRVAGKMTWQQLDSLYAEGWDIFNHSFTHKARSTASMTQNDYINEILLNRDAIKAKTRKKVETPLFVVPSGDTIYQGIAYAQGQAAVFDQPGNLIGIGGLNVTNDFSPNGRTIFRQYLADAINNNKDKFGDAIKNASATNKIWYNEFSHGVDIFTNGAGFNFYTFRSHMEKIANTYGKNGTDKIWMAPLQEVYEYMIMRNLAKYVVSVSNNQLILNFDLTSLPTWMRRKPITLVVNSTVDFSNVEVSSGVKVSFKGTGTRRIINLDFAEASTVVVNPCDTDTKAPVFTNCPQNISLTTTGTTATATWSAPSATDECSTPSVSSNFSSGNSFPIGTTTVIYTAKDAKNNTATCSFTVTITKTVVNPPITCANNLLLNAGFEEGLTNWFGGGMVSSIANSGTKSVQICSTNIRVLQSVKAKANTTYNLKLFTKKDPDAVGTYTLKFLSSSWAPIEQHEYTMQTITFKETTHSKTAPVGTAYIEIAFIKGNSAGCVFADDICLTEGNVVVNPCDTDAVPPILANCPQNINIETSLDSETVTWANPTATDNCSTPSVSSNFTSGQKFPIGATTIVYTAKDAKNNTATCSFTINIKKKIITTPTADMTLSLTTVEPAFRKYSNLNFIITAKNISNAEMTNSVVEFKFPKGTVTGGEVATDNGRWTEWCTDNLRCFLWTLPTLAPNSTATLRVPLFVMEVDTPMIATTNLLSSSPNDVNKANNNPTILIKPSLTQFKGSTPVFSTVKSVLEFDVTPNQNSTYLMWVTNKGAKTDYYAIEKATAKGDFEQIAIINEQYENENLNYYDFEDTQLQGEDNIYRIKVVLKDGSLVYSEPKKVKHTKIEDFVIFPNPATDQLSISLKKYNGKSAKLLFFNILGEVVEQMQIDSLPDAPLSINLSQYREGNYFIHIQVQGKQSMMKRFVVKR